MSLGNVVCPPGARDRKPTRRAGRKAPTLRPESNTSGTAGVRIVTYKRVGQEVTYLHCSLVGLSGSVACKQLVMSWMVETQVSCAIIGPTERKNVRLTTSLKNTLVHRI